MRLWKEEKARTQETELRIKDHGVGAEQLTNGRTACSERIDRIGGDSEETEVHVREVISAVTDGAHDGDDSFTGDVPTRLLVGSEGAGPADGKPTDKGMLDDRGIRHEGRRIPVIRRVLLKHVVYGEVASLHTNGIGPGRTGGVDEKVEEGGRRVTDLGTEDDIETETNLATEDRVAKAIVVARALFEGKNYARGVVKVRSCVVVVGNEYVVAIPGLVRSFMKKAGVEGVGAVREALGSNKVPVSVGITEDVHAVDGLTRSVRGTSGENRVTVATGGVVKATGNALVAGTEAVTTGGARAQPSAHAGGAPEDAPTRGE